MVYRAITICITALLIVQREPHAEGRVIYEAGRNNFRLGQIALLIESDQNTNVIVLIVETANLVLDGRLHGNPRHFRLHVFDKSQDGFHH